MTDLLREALAEGQSFLSVEKKSGVIRQSLMTFARGKQSLRLDKADLLAKHFGIESRRTRRKGKRT